MIIPVTISIPIQKYLKKLNYFLLETEDEFKYQRGNFMELLMCTIMKSGTTSNYANTQNGR